MSAIARCIAVARRRLLFAATMAHLGRLLLFASAAAVVLVLALRAVDQPVHPWVFAVLAGLIIVAAPVIALSRRPSREHVAVMIDERLQLRDRLGTALYAQRASGDAFAVHVVHEAEQLAPQLRLRAAFPIRLTRVWVWATLAAALVLATWCGLPGDPLGWMAARRDRLARQELAAKVEQERRQELAQAAAAIEKIDPTTQPGSSDDLRKSIADLHELAGKDLSDPQTRRDAAVKLSDAADKLDRDAQRRAQELGTIQNAMSQLKPDQPGPAQEFIQALNRGDFKGAMEALNDLRRQGESLSPDQRRQLEEQLTNLANQLAAAAAAAQAAQAAGNPSSGDASANRQPPQTQPASIADHSPATRPDELAGQNPATRPAEIADHNPATRPDELAGQNPATRPAEVADHNPATRPDELASHNPATQPSQVATQNPATQPSQTTAQNPATQPTQLANGTPQTQPSSSSGQCPNPQQAQGNSSAAQKLDQLSRAVQQMSRGAAQEPKPGEQGMDKGAEQAKEALRQFEQMRQAMQRTREAQEQVRQAMQQMSPPGGAGDDSSPRDRQTDASRRDATPPADGTPNHGPGNEAGDHPIDTDPRTTGLATRGVSAAPPGSEGRVISAWTHPDPGVKNAPGVDYDRAIQQARSDAEKAVTDDRVPRRYHQAIKDYFNQLPRAPQTTDPPMTPK